MAPERLAVLWGRGSLEVNVYTPESRVFWEHLSPVIGSAVVADRALEERFRLTVSASLSAGRGVRDHCSPLHGRRPLWLTAGSEQKNAAKEPGSVVRSGRQRLRGSTSPLCAGEREISGPSYH